MKSRAFSFALWKPPPPVEMTLEEEALLFDKVPPGVKRFPPPADGKRHVPKLFPGCQVCQDWFWPCDEHEWVELCDLPTSAGDPNCEICRSGIETCSDHMELCEQAAWVVCNFCFRYLCHDHAEAQCCPEVKAKREEVEEERKKAAEEKKKAEEEQKKAEEEAQARREQ